MCLSIMLTKLVFVFDIILSFPLRHAIEDCGTQMLEMDVRRTKDGVVVVSHDMNLKRLCGKGTVHK